MSLRSAISFSPCLVGDMHVQFHDAEEIAEYIAESILSGR